MNMLTSPEPLSTVKLVTQHTKVLFGMLGQLRHVLNIVVEHCC